MSTNTEAIELMPGIRCLVAPNPGMMTGPGTNTYLVGTQDIAVIDPGPAIDAHIERIVVVAGAPISKILATHTHPDHSPAAAQLAARTGAEQLGLRAPQGRHQDQTFKPDRELVDGERVRVGDVELQVIHTPGHASNHLCYLHTEHGWLFTGDHIINGSTVVIDPPDGDMSAYLGALETLKTHPLIALAPGHGEPMYEPTMAIDRLIEHRLTREQKVSACLADHPGCDLAGLVVHVYDDVDARLHAIAQRSLLAHLLKLERDGTAQNLGGAWQPSP
ncbi:MAG: MBL fold metallo-hydrolase [Pseudomonadota bacterium]